MRFFYQLEEKAKKSVIFKIVDLNSVKRLSLGQATFSSDKPLAMHGQWTVFPASVSAQESEITMPF